MLLADSSGHRVIEIDANFRTDGEALVGEFGVDLLDASYLVRKPEREPEKAFIVEAFGARLQAGIVLFVQDHAFPLGELEASTVVESTRWEGYDVRASSQCRYRLRFARPEGWGIPWEEALIRIKLGGGPRGVSLYVNASGFPTNGSDRYQISWSEGVRFPLVSGRKPEGVEDHDGNQLFPVGPSEEGVYFNSRFRACDTGFVVHELDLSIAVLEGLLWIETTRPGTISPRERSQLLQKAETFLLGRNRLLVKGRAVRPEIEAIKIVGEGSGEVHDPLPYYTTKLQARLIYPIGKDSLAEVVTLRWQLFSPHLTEPKSSLAVADGATMEHVFRPGEAEIQWQLTNLP